MSECSNEGKKHVQCLFLMEERSSGGTVSDLIEESNKYVVLMEEESNRRIVRCNCEKRSEEAL